MFEISFIFYCGNYSHPMLHPEPADKKLDVWSAQINV